MNLAKFIFDLAFDAGARAGRECIGRKTPVWGKQRAWEEYLLASNNRYPSRDLCPELFDVDDQTRQVRYQVLNGLAERKATPKRGRPPKVDGIGTNEIPASPPPLPNPNSIIEPRPLNSQKRTEELG